MNRSDRLNSLIRDCLQSGEWFVCADGYIWKKNWNKTGTTRRCRQRINAGGYARVTMKRPGERSLEVMAHRVVAFAFHGPPPSPRHEVNHINGDKTDNRPSNVEWVERPENMAHAWRLGLREAAGEIGKSGQSHHKAKLTDDDVREIHRLRGEMTQNRLAARYGVSQSSISLIHCGKNWPHIHKEFHP